MNSFCPFSLLNLPRRPYLSPELIDSTFRTLAATYHPDQSKGDAEIFQQVQEAVTTLRHSAKRLRALAGESKSVMHLPHEASTLFEQIGTSLQEAEIILARHHQASTSLAKALLLKSVLEAHKKLTNSSEALQRWQENLNTQLHLLDQAWPKVSSSDLLTLANSFTFAERWEKQLREALFKIQLILN